MEKSKFIVIISLIWRWPIYLIFYLKGITKSRYDRLYTEFRDDLLKYKEATLRQKIWAYKRGFKSDKIFRYGLTAENYKLYISDLEFYRKEMYKNRHFNYWYDDKLGTWFILQPFREYLPEHYYCIIEKKIVSLSNSSENDFVFSNIIDEIFSTLERKKQLALKKTKGGHGKGFYKLIMRDGDIYINGEKYQLNDFSKFVKSLNNYLITEFVDSEMSLREIFPDAPSVIRILSVFTPEFGSQIVGAFIRFPSKKSNYIIDVEGSIYCGVDIETGQLYDAKIDLGRKLADCERHPDTNATFNLVIKNWINIIQSIKSISSHLKLTPYLVYDLVATNDGFKILEINSHGIPTNVQIYYPFWKSKYTQILFQHKMRNEI